MTRGSIIFLKIVISLVAAGAIAICIFALPSMAADDATRHPDLAWQQYPFLAYAYILCILFLYALYHGFKLLTYADADKVFSELSVKSLASIKYCALTAGALVVAGVVLIMIMAAGKNEDITGIVMMGVIVTLGALIGATVVAVLQRHVEKAIELKSENDLTV